MKKLTFLLSLLLIATLFFACNTPSGKVTIIDGNSLGDMTSKMVKFFDKEIIDKQLYEIDKGALFDGMTPAEQNAAHFIIGIEIIKQGGSFGNNKPIVTRPTYLYLDENGNPVWDPVTGTWKRVGGCNGPWDDRDCDGIPNFWDRDIDGDTIPNGLDGDMDGDGTPNDLDDDMDGDGMDNAFDPNAEGTDYFGESTYEKMKEAYNLWCIFGDKIFDDEEYGIALKWLFKFMEEFEDRLDHLGSYSAFDDIVGESLEIVDSIVDIINTTIEWNISLKSSGTMMTVTQNNITIGRETITLEEYMTEYDIPNRRVIITER